MTKFFMLVKIFYVLEFFIFQGLMHEMKNIISFLFHRPTWRCQKKKKKKLLYRSCGKGDTAFFFCHVISGDPIIKETRIMVKLNPST